VQTILRDTLFSNIQQFQNNYFVDQMFDSWMWIMVKMMYAPYDLLSQIGDVEDWVKNVSLNGARWSNICNSN
jgi:hypothetical protein